MIFLGLHLKATTVKNWMIFISKTNALIFQWRRFQTTSHWITIWVIGLSSSKSHRRRYTEDRWVSDGERIWFGPHICFITRSSSDGKCEIKKTIGYPLQAKLFQIFHNFWYEMINQAKIIQFVLYCMKKPGIPNRGKYFVN